MALVTEPADYVPGDTVNETLLNGLKNPIYDEFNGNIDDANIKSGAAISTSKVADTAVVQGNTVGPGTQTITRPTTVSGGPFYESAQGGFSAYLDSSNVQTVDVAGVATFALTAGKGVYNVSSSGAAGNVTTITGGTEGDVIYIISTDTTNCTFVHDGAATANTLWLRGLATVTPTAGGIILRLRYTSLIGAAAKWYEV